MDAALYLRTEGRWFKVSNDYIAQVDARVDALPKSTMAMPLWNKSLHPGEADYNTYVAASLNLLPQDQQFLYPAGGYKVEPCDLLTEEGQFVHVKEGASSSCLNHLFGQIRAAAELYAHHEPSASEMRTRYAARWKRIPLADR